jgi:hypothetical protein
VVLRLEPGDEALPLLGVQTPKAYEGVHLVDVAPHRLGHAREPVDQRVRGVLQEVPLAVDETPECLVEQSATFPIPVADDVLREAHERGRHRNWCGAGRERRVEQLAVLAFVPEDG